MYLLFGISNWRWIMFWHSGSSHEALGKRGGRTFRGQRSRRITSTTSGIQTASIPAHCMREGGKHSLSVHILLCNTNDTTNNLIRHLSKHKSAVQANKICNDRPSRTAFVVPKVTTYCMYFSQSVSRYTSTPSFSLHILSKFSLFPADSAV